MASAAKKFVPSVSRDMQKDLAAAGALKHQLKELYGEETDVGLVQGMVEGETGLFETIDAVLNQVALDLSNIDGIAKFQTTLAARKKRLEDRVDNMRTMLLNALDILEEKRFERPIATLTVKDTSPKLVIVNESEIPAQYWKSSDPTLDKKELTDALKSHSSTLAQKLAELADRRHSESLSEQAASEAHDRIVAAFPAIPGVELQPGQPTVQIRFS